MLSVESRGQGPAVLCWPSLYCDARTLDPLVTDLARDYEVVLIDGPGHGGSSAPAGRCSLHDCADAAMEVLDALSIARAIWIGAAWGGHIGVLAAHRHRDRLSAWSYTGADDALFPVEEARRQSARISACRFAVVPHSAHQSALESPREVNPLVRSTIEAWLAR